MSARPELKVEDENGFVKFFRSLPDDPDTIRIFNRNDYFSAHGESANFIARTIYRTTSVVRPIGRDLPSVSMTFTVYKTFLREALFKLGKRVEVWESEKRMNWKPIKKASPGNLQDVEEDLGGYIETAPIILAVKVIAKATEARTVGVCFADASVRELGVSEFIDNDTYSNFESLVIQLGVKECLLMTDSTKKDPELSRLRAVADNCGCAIAERAAGDFQTKDIDQDLTRLLKDERSANLLPQTDLKLAMGSAAALIKYIGALTDDSNFGQYSLYQHDLSQYMKLDASALKALNLMPDARTSQKSMSMYGLLNHCKTPIGSRLLAQWLKQPLMDLKEIEKRQDLVQAFVADTELRQTMQEEHLRSVPDLYRMAKKFQRKKANLEDVVRMYQVAIRLPALVTTLENVMDEKQKDPLDAAYTQKLKEYNLSFSKLLEMVETTVDLQALDNHEFIIKSEWDETLKIVRKKIEKLKRDMTDEHRRVADDLNQDWEKKLFLENHRVHGWCLRLTRTEAACIRGKKHYPEISTQKNGVYFTTGALQEMRRNFDSLSETYNRTQSALVSEVCAVAASYVPVVEKLAAVLAHLDVVVSMAHASVHAPTPYTRPQLYPRASECEGQSLSDASTQLKEARHPCLEMQDGVTFITNDVSLAPGPEGPSFLIITGPNMGGKSTYIRMIACIALMAQVGCFVPCAEGSSITLFDCILARVGASDSQLKGVSTFMAEMLETTNILKSATQDSLIVIDELGRGTSTYDGFGLAWAIAEYIVKRVRACAAFATHFHELTQLADTWPQVRNLHVVAHVDERNEAQEVSGSQKRREVTLLYRVEPGVSDQSFGIHVAELVRFPEKVVRMARQKAAELEPTEADAKERPQISAEETAEGSRLLKEALKEWKKRVDEKGPTCGKEEKVKLMREVVGGREELIKSPFWASVKAL
ncbi:MAG: hypothetical protein Q9162_005286 [Coniocarpon cinnabarinum]